MDALAWSGYLLLVFAIVYFIALYVFVNWMFWVSLGLLVVIIIWNRRMIMDVFRSFKEQKHEAAD